MHSLVSTHTFLNVSNGEFVSMIDPPEPFRALSYECRNTGTWPVLVGTEGEKDTMLSAPIRAGLRGPGLLRRDDR